VVVLNPLLLVTVHVSFLKDTFVIKMILFLVFKHLVPNLYVFLNTTTNGDIFIFIPNIHINIQRSPRRQERLGVNDIYIKCMNNIFFFDESFESCTYDKHLLFCYYFEFKLKKKPCIKKEIFKNTYLKYKKLFWSLHTRD
jgi:hypothetical protein